MPKTKKIPMRMCFACREMKPKQEMMRVVKNADGEILVKGEPVIYGMPLFANVRNMDFPIVKIVPKDPSGEEKDVSYSNFGETVLLIVGEDNE